MSAENRIALLIGNCTYPNFCPEDLGTLTTPKKDVEGLQRTLKNQDRGRFNEVHCLLDCDTQEIRDGVEHVIREASTPDTLGLIYYSGHGLLDPDGRLHLIAKDSKPDTWSRSIPMSAFAELIRLHSPQRLVILLDCCYSGAALQDMEVKGRAPFPTAVLKRHMSENLGQLEAKGVVTITATTPIQQAQGDKSKGYGIFTKHILTGLDTGAARRGKTITARDLDAYVYRKMKAEVGNLQTPTISSKEVGGELVICFADLLGTNANQAKTAMGWYQVGRDILDHVTPAYILDRKFHFLDWNTSFEYFVAQPLGLRRGEHVEKFLVHLLNFDEVEKRSLVRFRPNYIPSVDLELLEYGSKDYGLIIFSKIATQIIGQNGRLKAWCVNLNVTSVQRTNKFWSKMEENLQRELNWSKYAVRYDSIITSFPEHEKLVEFVVAKVGEPERCLDLGAGTGSVTFSLLRRCPKTKILAIEKNGTMVDCMLRKIDLISAPDEKERITLHKGDIASRLRPEKDHSFDACMMLNVLFALDNPPKVMAEIFRVLRPGGVLALSTSHTDTNIDRLFGEIQKSLRNRNQWDNQTEQAWNDAFQRNIEMKDLINRDSIGDIKRYVKDAGFEILDFEAGHYVDCVVVIRAVKP